MAMLAFHLLGPPLISADGSSVRLLRRKAVALLAYLAVEGGPHSRDALATLLWENCGQSRARANLRRCIFALNEAVGSNLLLSRQDTLEVEAETIATDVGRFELLAAPCARHGPEESCDECLPSLREAAALYQNDFLFGFTLPDSVAFDEWQLLHGERLRSMLAEVLRRLIAGEEERGLLLEALAYARRLLSLDPLEETSHRRLMRLYAECGRRAAAYRQFEECRRVLDEELGEEPEGETVNLFEAIRTGRLGAASAAVSERLGGDGRMPVEEVTICRVGPVDEKTRKALGELFDESLDSDDSEDPAIVCALFPRAAEAVKAALGAQLSLKHALRIAIHTAAEGYPYDRSSPAYRHAEALLACIPKGEIILSAPAAARVNAEPPGGVTLRALGYHRLADLAPPEILYQVLHPQHIRPQPRIAGLDSRSNNLPSQPEPLVGRERELEELDAILRTAQGLLLSLTGPAGTGKTRLALQAAARAVGSFEDGVYFVDLAPLHNPDELLPAIAAVLELHEPAGASRPLAELLQGYLRARRALIILDNFEHLHAAAGEAERLLQAAPGLVLVATSRRSLGLRWEREYRVPPLALPAAGVGAAPRSEAERLFFLRALRVRPALASTPQAAATIAEICRRLDGLPLAIELAAARMRTVSPEELERRLSGKLSLLRLPASDRPARQQTLDNAIAWSYELLSPADRSLFVRLAVFVGGFSLEAAEQSCDGVGGDTLDVLDGIGTLVEQNLVRVVLNEHESRYSLLETIREYALARLAERPESRAIRDGHAAYYLRFAEEASEKLHGPEQMIWLDRLERDHGNLQEAIRWCLEGGQTVPAMRLCSALEWFWYRYGHFGEARKWVEASLRSTAPETTIPADAKVDEESAAGREERRMRGRTQRVLAWFLLVQGEWAASRDDYAEALSLARVAGDRYNETLCLSGLGTAERWLGQTTSGSGHVLAAVDLSRDLRDPLLIALSLIWAYATTGGRFSGAPPVAELDEALELSRRLGDLWCIAHAYDGLGDLYAEAGEHAAARNNYLKALESFRALKDQWLTAWCLEGLARVSLRARETREALRHLGESLAAFDELGDRANALLLLPRIAAALPAAGERSVAARILGAFDSLSRELVSTNGRSTPAGAAEEASELCRRSEPEGWAAGRAMSYREVVDLVTKLAEPNQALQG